MLQVATLALQNIPTQVTGIAECVGEVSGLHMVPGHVTALVRELFTQSAEVLLADSIFSHVLEQL